MVPDRGRKNTLKPRKTNFLASAMSPKKDHTQTQYELETKLMKGKNKENKWEVKNTLDKPRNHGIQDILINVRQTHNS
jgi:hypothetical protein